jgi:hypothetical protein
MQDLVLVVNPTDEIEYAASCPDLEQIAGAGLYAARLNVGYVTV